MIPLGPEQVVQFVDVVSMSATNNRNELSELHMDY